MVDILTNIISYEYCCKVPYGIVYGKSYLCYYFTFAKDVMLETIRPLGFIFKSIECNDIIFTLFMLFGLKRKVRPEDYSRLILCGLFGVAINMMFFKGLSYTTQPLLLLL